MSPRSGGFINEAVCGRELDDGTVGSVCGKPTAWRIQYEWMPDAEATACADHIDEARSLPGIVRICPRVSDEVWSRLYGFLGDRTRHPTGYEWEHGRLQQLVEDLITGPLRGGLLDGDR